MECSHGCVTQNSVFWNRISEARAEKTRSSVSPLSDTAPSKIGPMFCSSEKGALLVLLTFFTGETKAPSGKEGVQAPGCCPQLSKPSSCLCLCFEVEEEPGLKQYLELVGVLWELWVRSAAWPTGILDVVGNDSGAQLRPQNARLREETTIPGTELALYGWQEVVLTWTVAESPLPAKEMEAGFLSLESALCVSTRKALAVGASGPG